MDDRTLGEKLAISVGTAIPFEEKLVVEKPVAKQVWFNIDTLFRNYYGSFTDPSELDTTKLVKGLIEEAKIIQNLTTGSVEVVYYNTNKALLSTKFPLAKLVVPMTSKQKHYSNIMRMGVNALLSDRSLRVVRCKLLIPGSNAKATILTHYPLDLMSRYNFADLTLLNSHTGEVIRSSQWVKKLNKQEDYHRLPFNLLTLQVLGDGAKQFRSMGHKLKLELLKVAEKGRWNPNTTRDKVYSDLRHTDAETQQLFKKMLMVTLI